MGHRFIKKISHYSGKRVLALAVILASVNLLCIVTGIYDISLSLLSAGIWIVCFVLRARDQYYFDRTGGRDFRADKGLYDKNFLELIDFFKNAEPHRLKVNDLPIEDYHTADGIIFGHLDGHVIKRPSNGEGNCLMAGRPGDHKTTSVITTAKNFNRDTGGGGVLCIDIKGDIYNATHNVRNIKVFNPDDPNSCHFDPFAGIAAMTASERVTYVKQLSIALIPDQQGDNARFFVDGARQYFIGITLLELHRDINVTLPEILRKILKGDAITSVNEVVMSDCEEAKFFLASMRGTNEKNAAGCYQCLCNAVQPYLMDAGHLLDGSGDVISIDTLREHDIYLIIAQDKLQIYAPITAMIIQSFLTAFMRRKDLSTGTKNKPILFLIDEAPAVKLDYDMLQTAMASLRSKHVSIYLIIQSLSQLQKLYGNEGCRAILDDCSYVSVLSATDPESRKIFSSMVGEKKTLRVSRSNDDHSFLTTTKRSHNIQEAWEPALRPEDIGDLHGKVLIITPTGYILADKPIYFK